MPRKAKAAGRALEIAPIVPPIRPPQKLVSEFTTYHVCCERRVTNIHIMADQIDGMTVLPGADGTAEATVTVSMDPVVVQRELGEMAAHEGWTVLGLSTKSASLEDVFLSLTNGNVQ